MRSLSLPRWRTIGQGSVLLLLGLVVFLAWQEAPPGLLGKTDAIAYAVCHRLPSHSPFFGGVQFPLCFRCSGMYLGALATLLLLAWRAPRHSGFPQKWTAAFVGLAFAVFALDGLNAFAFDTLGRALYPPHNTLRLFTGFGAGLAIGSVLYPIVQQTFWRDARPAPALTLPRLAALLIILAALAGVMLWRPPALLYPLAVLSSGTVLLLLTLIYTAFVLGMLRRDGQAQRLGELTWPLLVGLLLALLQIVALDFVRFSLTHSWVGVLPR